MAGALADKWPVLGRHERAAEWLRIWVDLGREGVDPVTASRAHVAVYVRELSSRPSRRGGNVVSIDSGSGLANATIQQRLIRSGCFTTS
jgi:integrase/recombinase XerD